MKKHLYRAALVCCAVLLAGLLCACSAGQSRPAPGQPGSTGFAKKEQMGRITAIDGQTVTVALGGPGMGGRGDRTLAEGEKPERGEGEKPGLPQGEVPKREGGGEGEKPAPEQNGESIAVNAQNVTITAVDGQSAALADLQVGDTVVLTYGENSQVTGITVLGQGAGKPNAAPPAKDNAQ